MNQEFNDLVNKETAKPVTDKKVLKASTLKMLSSNSMGSIGSLLGVVKRISSDNVFDQQKEKKGK